MKKTKKIKTKRTEKKKLLSKFIELITNPSGVKRSKALQKHADLVRWYGWGISSSKTIEE